MTMLASRALMASILLGCGGPQTPAVVTAPVPEAPRCRFEGRVARLQLRTPQGGFVGATIVDAVDRAAVWGQGEALRVEHDVRREGWSLSGVSDPSQEDDFQLRTALNLDGGVLLSVDAMVRVVDARDGELLVAPPRNFPGPDRGYRFLRSTRQWVSCGDVRLAAVRAPRGDFRAQREAAGFSADLPERRILSAATVLFAQEPGGEPFFELTPRDHESRVSLVRTAGSHSQVLLQHYTGVAIFGWVPSTVLQSRSPAERLSGVLGALGGAGQPFEVCHHDAPIVVQATAEGHEPEVFANIAPGTAFVREELRPDGRRAIRPHQAGVYVPEGVAWSIQEFGGLSCRTEEPPSLAGVLGGLSGSIGSVSGVGGNVVSLSPPDAALSLRAVVLSATGLPSLSPGDTCELRVEHLAGDRRLACRTVVRCGELTLFGERATNGFHVCEFSVGDSPGVEGADAQTSQRSGDPAMYLNSRERSLRLRDDARGSHGAFELTAEIDTVEEASLP